jgi:hypothetical protein
VAGDRGVSRQSRSANRLSDEKQPHGRGLYWFIADHQGEWPWEAVRPYDPGATARMVEGGKMRLVKGQWPDIQHPIGRSISMPSQQEIYTKVSAALVEAL